MPEALEALGAEIVKLEAAEEFDEGMKKIEELKKQLEDFERKRSLTDDASKSDEETQKVRANIARATDRAVSHVDGQGQEVMKAVHAFEKQAEAQIDTVIEDDSDLVNWAGPFITVIGTLVSAVFPPAAGFVAGTAFVASLSVGAAVAGTTAEAGGAKQALRNWIGQYATAVSNALSKGLDAEKLSLPERLNSLARTDKSIWDLLAGSLGNEELDQLMTRLHIPNPAKQSCYGQVLKGLMAEWGSSSAKVKAQHGKTKHQRMIDDNVPSDPSSKDVRKKMGDGRKSGAAQGSQAAKDRQE